MLTVRAGVRITLAVLVRPHLWLTAIRQLRLLARPRWWTRPPWLPIPDAEYLRFRVQTAYGDADRAPDACDVVTYLEWCRAWPRIVEG